MCEREPDFPLREEEEGGRAEEEEAGRRWAEADS